MTVQGRFAWLLFPAFAKRAALGGFLVIAALAAGAVATHASTKPPAPHELAPPVEDGPWLVPAAAKKAEPVWGIKGGIVIGLWPTGGPRGLFRIYTQYLGQPRLRMINFVSVEPIVKGKRGLSELEKSALDRAAGKAMWTADERETNPKPRHPWEPARGRVIALDGTKALTFFVFLERFENGAAPIIQVLLRQDRPHEVAFRVYSAKSGAVMDACVLSATMGNYARLRRLWLKDEVVDAPRLWPKFQPDNWGFARWQQWEAKRMHNSGSIAVVAATPSEADPARASYAPNVPRHWRYEGRRATQYWKAPVQKGLVVRVNGRKTFWSTQAPIPGGVSYENFELKAPFRPGQEFRFGVIAEGPQKLGFDPEARKRPADNPTAKSDADRPCAQ